MKYNGKWSKILSISLGVLALIAISSLVYASSGAEGGHGAPAGPTFWGLPTAKWWDLLWRTLNFAILLIVLIKVLAKPIANGSRTGQPRPLRLKDPCSQAVPVPRSPRTRC